MKNAGKVVSREDLLREGDAVTSGSVGRREIPVSLNTRCACALGMLINLRQAMLSAVWLDGTVIFSEEIPLAPRAAATVLRAFRQVNFTI